jgi:hypothetical protein
VAAIARGERDDSEELNRNFVKEVRPRQPTTQSTRESKRENDHPQLREGIWAKTAMKREHDSPEPHCTMIKRW